jgi:hypothetical protein
VEDRSITSVTIPTGMSHPSFVADDFAAHVHQIVPDYPSTYVASDQSGRFVVHVASSVEAGFLRELLETAVADCHIQGSEISFPRRPSQSTG